MEEKDLIGYDKIIEKSMRQVMVDILKNVEKHGLRGGHYFIISFLVKYPEVEIPKHLAEKYPEEMTIAIQYQYRNLVLEKDCIKISLSFAGKFERLCVPFAAITSFSDPSMNFVLKFSLGYEDAEDLIENNFHEDEAANISAKKEKNPIDLSAKVISLDAFRHNKKDGK
jgi:hypothetical protein